MISKSALALRNSTVSARLLLANTQGVRRFSTAAAGSG